MTLSKQQFQKYENMKGLIRGVLVQVWSPLKSKDSPNAWDEYDSYLFRIFEKIEEGASEDDIANYLVSLEIHSMGLSSADRERASEAASKLIGLRLMGG